MEDLLIKAATVIAVALATFSSFPSAATNDPQQQQQQQTTILSSQMQPPSTPPRVQSRDAFMSDDFESTEQGDAAAAKTRNDAENPQGSKLVGHVTDAQPRIR